MSKVDVTSDTWTLHPPTASLQPLLVLLILQGQTEWMQGQRDAGCLLASPHLWLTVPSAQPSWTTAWEQESCAHPKPPRGLR